MPEIPTYSSPSQPFIGKVAQGNGSVNRLSPPDGVPFQVVQLNGDGGLDSRFRGNDGLSAVIPLELEPYLLAVTRVALK